MFQSDKIKELLCGNEWVKPLWMRKRTFERLGKNYYALDDMADLADLFSLRNVYSAQAIHEKYHAP